MKIMMYLSIYKIHIYIYTAIYIYNDIMCIYIYIAIYI